MKIGVFGDSFAERLYNDPRSGLIWYNYLVTDHGHEVESYGEMGSSILFSADLIQKHAADYDLSIWCLTNTGRYSMPHREGGRTVHVTPMCECTSRDVEVIKKHSVWKDYLRWIYDLDTEIFVGRCIVQYLQTQYPNLMIIPCFVDPLHTSFNLFNVCEQEAQFYFPGRSVVDIYGDYVDLRPGHITAVNQKILAALINDALGPGLFQSSYEHFVPPQLPFDQVWSKKK